MEARFTQVKQIAPPFTPVNEGADFLSGERNKLQTDTKQLQQTCLSFLPLPLTEKQGIAGKQKHKQRKPGPLKSYVPMSGATLHS